MRRGIKETGRDQSRPVTSLLLTEVNLLRGLAERPHAACANVQALHFAIDHNVLAVHVRSEVAIRSAL
jgi:hypothetical protein